MWYITLSIRWLVYVEIAVFVTEDTCCLLQDSEEIVPSYPTESTSQKH